MYNAKLIFDFEPIQCKEFLGDNGTAWRTDYKINFTVNKIKFRAEYSSMIRNGNRYIEIFHENLLIADEIHYDHFRCNEEKIREIIQDAFYEDKRLNKFVFVEKKKLETKFRNELFANLMKNCEWT